MNKISARNVRGMPDLVLDEAKLFNRIIQEASHLAEIYNFKPIILPIVEFAEVFERTMGETSDVVNKEIYSFYDRSENKLALRPEFTASIVRAVLSNKLLDNNPLRLFTSGPVFRYDRPQKCRQRQFNQINYEILGIENPYIDAEMIAMAMNLLQKLGIKNMKLYLNSIGTSQTREIYSQLLVGYLENYKDELSEDSQLRLIKNPLRILDSKNLRDQEILDHAPKISQAYDDESKLFFDKLQNYLIQLGIEFFIDNKLVRGLDYYSHSVFEIITEELGAQGTILAGGRYNHLSEFFGAKAIPSFGWAGGVERLMNLCSLNITNKHSIAVLAIGENSILQAGLILKELHDYSMISEILIGNQLKKLLSQADKENFEIAIFVGEDEINNNNYVIRNLKNGEQVKVTKENIITQLHLNLNY